MSLEDMSNDQVNELAALAKQLSENPETRKDFLRLTKKAKPEFSIPELEIEDATTHAVSKAYERVEGLENKLRERDARDSLNERRQSLLKKGLAKDDADIESIEKVIRKILQQTSLLTALCPRRCEKNLKLQIWWKPFFLFETKK